MIAAPALDPAAASPAPAPKTRRVVDAPMRMFHLLFALSFAGAWLTAESEHWRLLHVTLGYTFGALLGFRLLYGLVGPRPAWLISLWRRLAGAPAWARSMTEALRTGGAMPWRQGQNLAMALVLVALLALALPLVLSGWGSFNDTGEVFEEVHEFFANALLALVLAHLGLIALVSLLRRQNVALPMLTGRVQGSGPDLVRQNRTWLAAALLIATLALGTWLWRDAAPGGGAGEAAQGRASLVWGEGTRQPGAAHAHDDDRDD